MQKKRKIVVFIEGDFTLLASGSHLRFKEMLDLVSSISDHVTVYSFINHATQPWTNEARERFSQLFPKLQLVLEHRSASLLLLTRIKNMALAFLPNQAHKIIAWKINGATPLYEAMSTQAHEYFFVLNFLDLITVANGFPFKNFIIDTHDIKFLRWANVRNFDLFDIRVLARLRSELGVLAITPALIAISASESIIFKTLAKKTKTFFAPRLSNSQSHINLHNFYTYDLMFVGTETQFNIEGILSFMKNHREWIGERSIAIVGKVGEDLRVVKLAKTFKNTHILGFVKDISTIYHQSKAVISPVEGTGLKIKILEALAHGKPIFASEHSKDGLPLGFNNSVFSIEPNIMTKVLDEPNERMSAEEAVKQYWQYFDAFTDKNALVEYVKNKLAY
jgi:glycosyltransferase involved in cell wall biosynthesis